MRVPVVETLVKQIQVVLEYEDNLDPELISAYSVWRIYNQLSIDEERMQKNTELQLDNLVKSFGQNYYTSLHSFNADTGEVSLSIHTYDWQKFYFKKENGDLHICNSDGYVNFNVLRWLGECVEEYYDYCMKLSEMTKESCHGLKTVNSDFVCHFMNSGVCVGNNKFLYSQTFRVGAFSNDKHFSCECNSNNVLQLLKGRKDEFVQKVFVRIIDCPKWMQDKLREMRKAEFEQIVAAQKAKEEEERRKAEEERVMAEKIAKKQKRREFLKKIFPVLK